MSIVIDLNLACLVCLQQDEKQLHPVFEHDEQQIPIAERIALCSELRLDPENSKLPDKICQHCLDDLETAWRFRQNCATANTVFQTILQEEEQAEAIANFELEQQNIKLPIGLKIKRVPPQTKTYILPVQLDEEGDETGEDVDEIDEQEDSTMSTENVGIIIERPDEAEQELEDTEEELADEEEREEERAELEQYYVEEQVLHDGNDYDEDELEEDMESIGSVESEIKNIAKENRLKSSVGKNKNKCEESEDEQISSQVKEEYIEDADDACLNESPKRTRGRPKKIKIESVSDDESRKPSFQERTKIKLQSMNLNKTFHTTKPATKAKMKSKAKTSLGSKLGSSSTLHVLPTRKRKSLSPDARPAKICEICGNSYKYQHALNAHMRRHTNTRPFGCEFCDKAFVSNVELRRHMRVHTGHKPYACQYCERRFSDFGSRIKHERTHTGERPYICTCGKSFAYAHVLSVHMRTHTGEKKFQCQVCSRGFTKKAYLETHMEVHLRSAETSAVEHDAMQQQHHQHPQTPSRGELMTVALEECIFTTEYIEQDERDDADRKLQEQYEITEILEDEINEEHLEDSTVDDTDYIMAVR